MKIRVTENQVMIKNRYKEGNIEKVEQYHHPLRSWDVEFDEIELKEVWVEIKGDIRELIRIAKSGYSNC